MGVVTSVSDIAANTDATYESGGKVELRPQGGGGGGLRAVISASALRMFLKRDGSNVGVVHQQSGGLQLARGELAKQSRSTLTTLLAAMTPAERQRVTQSGSATTTSPQTGPSTTNPGTTSAPITTSQARPESAGQRCGTITGGPDDFKGEKLTVYATAQVSCATAMHVMTDLSTPDKAQNHPGQDIADSYYTVDGWTCPWGNMGTSGCHRGSQVITAYTPGTGP